MRPKFPVNQIDCTKSKKKNSSYWFERHTLIEDLSCPLHEVQRGWIRKPVAVLFLFVLCIPAIFLALILASIEFFTSLNIYIQAAAATFKGQER